MDKTKTFFTYKRRFDKSIKKSYVKFLNKLKIKLFRFVSGNKILSKYFSPYERIEEFKFLKKFDPSHWYQDSSSLNDEENFKSIPYENISLNEVIYFKTVEIDNFGKWRKKLIAKFHNDEYLSSAFEKKRFKNDLVFLKDDLGTISFQKIASLNFSKKPRKTNDLISYVRLSFIKTEESYFILRMSVKPSNKFEEIFKEIVKNEGVNYFKTHYNNFRSIIKTRRFVSYKTYPDNLKIQNIKGLLEDLDFQVKESVLKNLIGDFHSVKLPKIEFYIIDNIIEFKKDSEMNSYFRTSPENIYTSKNKSLKLLFKLKEDRSLIQVIKQKFNESSNADFEFSTIEEEYLLRSLSFPCVFQGILFMQQNRLNKLKREVYDYVSEQNNRSFFNRFLFIFSNLKYVKLKQRLAYILAINKRFENEFTEQKILVYTHEFKLEIFKPFEKPISDENNLLNEIIKKFISQIKELNSITKSTNEIFKIVEELNSFRTNLILQIVSLAITFLAFIFAFQDIRSLFNKVMKYIFSLI